MKEDFNLIGGKAYKECIVVMLPTKPNDESAGGMWFNHTRDWGHLYILSNEEIKEGDWVYDSFLKKVLQINTSHKKKGEFVMESNADGYKKIIATTNGDLHIEIPCPDGIEGCEVYHAKLLPKPSNDFLKAYCKANGKMEKILVEYEKAPFEDENNPADITYHKLKVAPDNTITIKPVQLSIEEAANDYIKQFLPHNSNDVEKIRFTDKGLINIFKAGSQWRDNNPSGEKYNKEQIKKLIELYATTYIEGDISKWIENNL